MRLSSIVARVSFALVLSSPMACQSEPTAKDKPAPTTTARVAEVTGSHAPANVEPGSHEDWCEEHQVAESQCTRCNPSLVAAFKATGDWCPEHGVPESQCRLCNPALKLERPPKKAVSE